MKRIFHPGGSVVTGSELADAVMHYAESLSHHSQVDVVDIPIVCDGGTPGRAQFLIGASSHLFSVSTEADAIELMESETADNLHRMAMAGDVRAPAGWTGEGLDSPQFDEYDY